MRTTFNAVNRHTQYVIGNRYSDLAELQKKIATGKELARPSDDPVAVSNVIGLRSNNTGLKQFEKNTTDGLGWMEITDTTMVSMNTILQRGRELAIQGDSDTLSTTERAYIAEEIEQLTRQMISLSNSKFKGDYIFSGSHTNKPPVPIAPSAFKGPQSHTEYRMGYFNGTAPVGTPIQIFDPRGNSLIADSKVVRDIIPGSLTLKIDPQEYTEGVDYSVDYLNGQITILPGATPGLAANFNPTVPAAAPYNTLKLEFEYASESEDLYGRAINTDSDLFREIESGVQVAINTTFADFTVNNSVNAITSMIRLGGSLLANDQPGIRVAMDEIDTSFNKILSAQSENGAKVNLFNTTRGRNENQQVETTRIQSQLEDADYSDVISNYAIAQTVFDAALQSTAKIMQSSLANYL